MLLKTVWKSLSFRCFLVLGLILCLWGWIVSAQSISPVDTIGSKVDTSYKALTQKVNKTRLSSAKRRLRTTAEKSALARIATASDETQKLLAQTLWTKIQWRTQKEILPTQDLVLIRQVVNATNSERKKLWLPALTLNYKLTMAAYRHARDLRQHFPYDTDGDGTAERLSHKGSDGSTMTDRVESFNYNWMSLAENVAYNQTSVEEVMRDWMNSSHHRDNIISSTVKEIGIAKVGSYRVQVFGSERKNK